MLTRPVDINLDLKSFGGCVLFIGNKLVLVEVGLVDIGGLVSFNWGYNCCCCCWGF